MLLNIVESRACKEAFRFIKDCFSNAVGTAKQLVKVNVGSFWKWFVVIPNEYRFVIPIGGVARRRVVKIITLFQSL